MRIGKIEVKRRVWIALLCAVAVSGLWWQWTRSAPVIAPVAAAPMQPQVRLTGVGAGTIGSGLREDVELMDPTPLFFPTKWNYGQRPLQEGSLKQPGQVFSSFEPKLPLSDRGVGLYGIEAAPAPEKLSDVLTQGNEAPFAGMGQVDLQKSTLPIRSGYLEVSDLKNGNVIISQPLVGFDVPRRDFPPMEFLVLIGPAGLIGDPFLTSGSAGEEMDAFFRSYLVKSYRLGERLRPGRYRVLVGA